MIHVDNLRIDEATRLVGKRVADASKSAWIVTVDGDLVLTAGVARESLLGEAELWLQLGPYFNKHFWAACRALLPMLEWVRSQYPKLIVRVEPEGERLAQFCGMEFVGWSEWPDGRCWRKYE